MARTNNLTNFLTDVADAIRTKTGSSAAISAANFDTEIESIPGGIVLGTKSFDYYDEGDIGIVLKIDDTIIPTNAFNCKDITALGGYVKSITIGKNVEQIGDYSFCACAYGTPITFESPSSIISIGSYGFGGYYTNRQIWKLPTEISLPSVTSLGQNAFSYCTALQKITFGNSLVSIPVNCFVGCSALNDFDFDNITSIGESAFYGTAIESISLKNNFNVSGRTTFANMTHLKQFSMPGSANVTQFGGDLFNNDTGLKAVWLGNINGRYIFGGCTSLEYIFVNQSRATMEAKQDYSNLWDVPSAILSTVHFICNDDTGFMTQDAFDAIDWSNYQP